MSKQLKPGHYLVEDWAYPPGSVEKSVTIQEYDLLTGGGVIEFKGEDINIYDGPFRIMAEPDPEPEPTPAPVEREEPPWVERLIGALSSAIQRDVPAPEIVVNIPEQEPPTIVIENKIEVPEQQVNVSVEMPDYEETQVIERDEEGFIAKVRKIVSSRRKADEPEGAPSLQDQIRAGMGLPPAEEE